MMIEVTAEDRSDEHGQQWEHGEDTLSRLTHVTHITIGDKCYNRESQQTVLQVGFLLEVRSKTGRCHNEHDDILNDGDAR